MFSLVANLTRAQEKIKDVVTRYKDGHEVITEQMMPSDDGVVHVVENFTVNAKNNSIMDHSLNPEHKGDFAYFAFH